ncbi:serine/threonine protein kinase [Phormidesmis priestleyi]|uniref:serine/threonine protein kinase n=1 Tax=Phormidesmis priestleyi TaxID=268141 RepID=UPI00083A86F2|nr:serine/threonine-protein kinase [Phormidesmis priestleyi]
MELLHDRYQVEQSLGKKAGRQTLLARDLQTQKLVVVKLLTFNHEFEWDDLKLFEREAETLKSLNHPAIPRYLDYFELESPTYKGVALVQSYIEAKSLDQHLKAGRSFSQADVQQLGQSLLEILIYLHSQSPPVVHRDIKPSNILLGDRSGTTVGQVYLVDFGSVQTLVAHEGSTITVVGTYGYMPPEQYGGRATPASDLYSLGATLICLATGKHPADLPQANLRIQFKSSATLNEAMTDWLEWLTEPAIDRRLQSAQEALRVLRAKTARSLSTPKERKIVPQITKAHVLWSATWRSSLTGAAFAISSVIIAYIINSGHDGETPISISVMLILAAGAVGSTWGYGNGLLMASLTNRFFSPLKNHWIYRLGIGIIPMSVSLIAILIACTLTSTRSGILLFPVLAGLAVAMSPMLASQLFANWYIKASRAVRRLESEAMPDRNDP